jgi:2-iminoacetate synthase
MTLQEYLLDYASAEIKAAGVKLMQEKIKEIPNEKMRALVIEHLEKIKQGSRDFRV